jgi:hypothetical protein
MGSFGKAMGSYVRGQERVKILVASWVNSLFIENSTMFIFRFQTYLFFKQLLFVFTFAATFVLLTGCATAPFKAPLTATERQFLARIDPNASVVTKITEQTIEVSNATYPAIGLEKLWGVDRYVDTLESVKEVYPHDLLIYERAAFRYCASIGQHPDDGIESGPNSKRFTCRQPKEWAVLAMRQQALRCEEFQSNKRYYIFSWNHHPCSVIPAIRPPVDFCAAYSNLTNLTPTSNLTCPAFLNQVRVIEANLTASPATGQHLGAAKTIDSAIKECTGLGFIPKTEKHADCVLRLTK